MKKLLSVASAVLLISLSAVAQKSEVFVTNEVAIRGYDAVAYFTQSKPVMGSKDYSYAWNNATWYFSSKENLDAFKKEPQKYAPQFGGYCAYGLSQGHKAPTDPDAWTIVENKLYLNYNKDVQKMWKAKMDDYIKQAEKNWTEIKDKE